ncbi:hypothetical protein QEZ40_000307 [Streptomyces katrae]|uniref:Secreted protein n=1 Tax=Streptomyces katrae TaxID=68223 RepID=A0ABT7GLH1_9ACTN|nr:hypothetical protein [Streptomyces katrae]MDK9494435.1 hypothetical protein [Streptomyces katrae]
MAGTGQATRRGIARLLALCAVLLGLFLMHGAPATAAEGCHGVSAPAPMHADTAAAAMTPAQPAPAVQMEHGRSQHAMGASAPHGEMCVSTPARERMPLPLGGLLTVVAGLTALFLVGRPLTPGWTGRRGPPPSYGRSLLLQVCVART